MRIGEHGDRFSGVVDLVHVWMSFVRNSGDPVVGHGQFGHGSFGEDVFFNCSPRYYSRKSDKIIVVMKPVNNVAKTVL